MMANSVFVFTVYIRNAATARRINKEIRAHMSDSGAATKQLFLHEALVEKAERQEKEREGAENE